MQTNRNSNTLTLKRIGIDTQWEYFIYMQANCHICRSEGFESLTKVQVTFKEKSIIATLNVLRSDLLRHSEAGLSESAWKVLGVREGNKITITHLQPVESMSLVRSKIYGKKLDERDMNAIVKDITLGHYSSVQLAAFITSCSGDNMDIHEIAALTKAMVNAGQKLRWKKKLVVDKHCVGGLPGNRTTPIVVAIVAAAGLTIPKTSSRAITSPAGTADVMETMTDVSLNLKDIKRVVHQEGGCLVWGGAVQLSPADDLLIKIEKALDFDGEGLMIASVLSKKAAAGSTHVVIDIPVGPTAKVRTLVDAHKLKYYFTVVGQVIGLQVEVLITDGNQPVGNGIGPVPEAMDVLSVLRGEDQRPKDLEERALMIAGAVLELAGTVAFGQGKSKAQELLESGKAYQKFLAISKAQGGFKQPKLSPIQHQIYSEKSGVLTEIDNRKLAMVAKLSGAPSDARAGLILHKKLGDTIKRGQALFTIYTDTQGELNYTLKYLAQQSTIFKITRIKNPQPIT